MEEKFDYRFEFFKPGKKFFYEEEINRILGFPNSAGFEVILRSSKNGLINVELKNKEIVLDFCLQSARGERSLVATLSMTKRQMEENFGVNSNILLEVALYISAGLKPYFAWGDHSYKLKWLERRLSFDTVGALAWVNLFSKEFVNKLGGIEEVLIDKSKINVQEANKTLKTLSVINFQLCTFPGGVAEGNIHEECKKRWPKVLL